MDRKKYRRRNAHGPPCPPRPQARPIRRTCPGAGGNPILQILFVLLECTRSYYLILGFVPGTREAGELVDWVKADEILVTTMTSWYEFLCGPVNEAQMRTMRAFIRRILPFDEPQAVASARLYNATGRKRGLRGDCMIAGSALHAGARLATSNRNHFAPFAAHGLELV